MLRRLLVNSSSLLLAIFVATNSMADCGPVIIAGHDAEQHGFETVYASLFDNLMTNVSNGGSGILVIGGDPGGDADNWSNNLSALMAIPQTVTLVNGAAIGTIDFTPYAILFIASSVDEAAGGINQTENDLLATRAADIAAMVNSGGALFAMTQGALNNPWAYLTQVAPLTVERVTAGGFDDVTATVEGALLGLSDTNVDGCCFHEAFSAWPSFLKELAKANEPTISSVGGLPINGLPVFLGGQEACLTPFCGDGILDPGEVCDDGNTVPRDGCDGSCAVECDIVGPNVDAGWGKITCTGVPVTLFDSSTSQGATVVWSDGGAGGIFSPSDTFLHATYSNPTPGTYQLTLTATGPNGCVRVDVVNVTVLPEPIALFDYTPNPQVCFGCDPVQFIDMSTGNPTAWSWTFGDGETSNLQHPNHVYRAPGTYDVNLVVTSPCGVSLAYQLSVDVVNLPVSDLIVPTTACVGQAVPFTNASSPDATSVAWSFGDGSPVDNNFDTTHVYNAPGIYTVSITASNGCGVGTPEFHNITIVNAPTARFTSDAPRCTGPVCFEDTSLGEPTGWTWNFGDGTPLDNTSAPCHTYAAPGTYTVTLTTTNACGTSTPFQADVTFDPALGSAFNRWTVCENPRAPGTAGCPPYHCPEDTTTGTTVSDSWEFNDSVFCRPAGSCTFAMYAVADCGTSMNFPFYDVESGHMRVFDVINNQYVSVDVGNEAGAACPWSQSGVIDAQWADANCDGTDCRYNGVTTTVSFGGTPAVCGVYRLEFIDWGGFWWDLFANCDGTNTPGFQIYDNICDAIAAYNPLPELSLSNVVVTGACPEFVVTFDALNSGCVTTDATIRVEATGGIAVDVLLTGLQPGVTRQGRTDLTAASCLTGQTITATIDPYATVTECTEAVGSSVSCDADPNDGQVDIQPLPTCLNPPLFCGALAAADVDPCEDTGVHITWAEAIDPGGSASVTYTILRDGVPLQTGLTVTEYFDDPPLNGTPYSYSVEAVNDCGTVLATPINVIVSDEVCPPPVCGDGILEGSEACDDGNPLPGDGCRADCSIEICGDGILDSAAGEQCDDSNTIAGDGCRADCTVEACGDNVLDVNESCDDGNQTSGDGCRANCTLERCGDGIMDAGELCDDGNTVGGDGCRANCTLETCGDGIIDSGELCDDGNAQSGDGCRANCTAEVCGDGITDVGEACDDGNIFGGDGCRPDCTAEVCGDGTLDSSEQCDDGNTTSGDGCADNCLLENLGSCGDGVLDAGESCDDGNNVSGDGCRANCTEEVCGDGFLDAGESCDDGNNNPNDGCRPDCSLPTCGDGIVDNTEQCDDGNAIAGDGCRANCTPELCGDSILDANEACDDGNFLNGDGCRADCQLEICGNGLIDVGETCDDGNVISGDGCRANCTVERCGDGVLDSGEACDDGNLIPGDGCRVNCTVERCGDLILDIGETCDDGNTIAGDGCNALCLHENLPTCGNGVTDIGEACDDGNNNAGDGCRGDCTPELCGDGILDPAETCDDGNIFDDDGCHSNCIVELCGDGVISIGELCDDGNLAAGDGCRADCTVESCGDGRLDPGELCDDNNTISGDGCDDLCQVEGINLCGDGNLDAGEDCDDGNTFGGDGCRANCTLEVCGDGILDFTELCDDGNTFPNDGCRGDCTTELCGDGVLDITEICDDGNLASGDGCRANCTPEACGDGILDPGETCDDGNANSGDGCSPFCRVEGRPACGDGILAAGEQCDDGNYTPGDGCRADCTVELCGDVIVDPQETCDDGNTTPGDGCSGLCEAEVCGDGILVGLEACDDGNTVGGDGCRADCTLEMCGDGTLDANEQCDDGNIIRGDGCRPNCTVERCGDGMYDPPGESCDDGNTSGGDGCSASCTIESGGCGDGRLDPGEECDHGSETPSCDSDCTRVVCGDGHINPAAGEQCDDGNQIPGDGCNQFCQNEGGCAAPGIQPIVLLKGVKNLAANGPDFTHFVDPLADGYNTWFVTTKQNIPNARQGGAGNNPIGCAPAPVNMCLHNGALPPASGTVLFYQVRGVCGNQEAAE